MNYVTGRFEAAVVGWKQKNVKMTKQANTVTSKPQMDAVRASMTKKIMTSAPMLAHFELSCTRFEGLITHSGWAGLPGISK